MENKRICKKCLLRDMKSQEYESIAAYMERIEEELKAEPIEYERRLGICKECDYLNSGTCGACGCYAELRALIKTNQCPYYKW